MKFQMIVAIGSISILVTEYIAYRNSKIKRNYKFFYLGLICMGCAQIFSQLDLKRIWCNPADHIFQGHALWHLLGAIGLLLAFRHWMQDDYSDDKMP